MFCDGNNKNWVPSYRDYRGLGLVSAYSSITLAQTRDMLKTSRKYAQALLEHLDEIGVTKRTGDERVLRQKP